MFRILWVERDGADRLNALFVEHRPVSRPTIIRFPNAPAGRANKKCNLARRLACARDGRDAPAHCCRADITRAQAGDCRGSKRRFLSMDRSGAKKKRKDASHSKSTACEIEKDSHSVLRKLWECARVVASFLASQYPHRSISAVVGGDLFDRENEISCHPPARWLRL